MFSEGGAFGFERQLSFWEKKISERAADVEEGVERVLRLRMR
jgi:hypothetical protein